MTLEVDLETNRTAELLSQLWAQVISDVQVVNFVVFVEYNFCFKLYFHLFLKNAFQIV